MHNFLEICYFDAVTLVDKIRHKEISVEEVVRANIQQIENINPLVNAVVTFNPELAIQEAKDFDHKLAKHEGVGTLYGVPVLYKDVTHTKGIRTTMGSPLYKDNIPEKDSIVVERLKEAGTICLGKTNVPEFAAGSQTFNRVFGSTLNPFDRTKTCGGSSGGSAVSLACGFAPIADGTDFGGSLRNPASFCNVVGFRPSCGRVPVWPKQAGWFPLSVAGPMARKVADAALMLSVMAGPDNRDPLSLDTPGRYMSAALERDFKGVKIAWSPTIGGLPVERGVSEIIANQCQIFENLGCVIDDVSPDLSDADEIFHVLRAWYFKLAYGDLLPEHESEIKDTILWNIKEGEQISGVQLGVIEKKRTNLYARVNDFMSQYDFWISPVVQVLPFDIDTPYVTEINGTKLSSYIDWMKSCSRVSVAGLPAVSVPCGFSSSGLPVGIQIIGGNRKDFEVLQLAHAFEQNTSAWQRRPAMIM